MKILVVLLGLAFLAAIIALLVWSYGDAETRGKPGWLVVLMMILLSPLAGLVVWLLIRPDEPVLGTAKPPAPT